MRVNLSEIKFEESGSDISKVQLLRAGKYSQWDGASLEITTSMLREMKINFDSNVRKVDCAIDYFHNSYAEAAGWIKEIILENSDTELWCVVEWTDAAKEKILSKEIRYLSADFTMKYVDNESGQEYSVVLNGGGLTNRPFVKGMNPILDELSAGIDKNPEKIDDIRRILFNNTDKGTSDMNFEDLKKAIVTVNLSDEQKKEVARLIGLDGKEVKLSEENLSLKALLDAEKKNAEKLSDENKALKKEAEFNVLLSDGKVVPAQKDAFMKGDMAEFVKQAVVVNLSASGSGVPSQAAEPKTKEEAEDKVIKLAEEKQKATAGLSVSDAISAVLSENPALKKLING